MSNVLLFSFVFVLHWARLHRICQSYFTTSQGSNDMSFACRFFHNYCILLGYTFLLLIFNFEILRFLFQNPEVCALAQAANVAQNDV